LGCEWQIWENWDNITVTPWFSIWRFPQEGAVKNQGKDGLMTFYSTIKFSSTDWEKLPG